MRHAGSAGALGLMPGGPALAADATPIKIANATGIMNLAMDGLMKQEKFLESFGLAPEMLGVADGSKILGAIVSGSVDGSSMSGFGQVFPAVERGASLKILAAGVQAPILAMFTTKPNVKTLKDLEGKSVGTGSIGALVYQLTVALLQKHGVDVHKIQFVNIGSSANIFRAVQAGTVDAGPCEASLMGSADAYHVRAIPGGNMTTELPLFTFNGAWASDAKIASSRPLLVKMLAAYAKLYRFVQQPSAKDAFLRCMHTVLPSQPVADHLALWSYIQTYKPFAENLVIGQDRIDYIQKLNVSFGVQKAVLPYAKVADVSLAKDALKLLG
jgi:ABC-type nitrate/sulfonate/bicarbonate transport system substrate-binding protein